MNNSAEDQLKLNIFALPNQTTLLFGVIVAVILGAVLAAVSQLRRSQSDHWPSFC
jgi:hypothetical protein